MAKLPGSFSTKEVEGRKGDFKPVPAGEYRARLKESTRTATKETIKLPKAQQSKGVHYYKMVFEIVEGEYKGRLIYINLNLEHEKDNVRQMAEEELASIGDACGKVSFDDTEELHNIDMLIKVGIKAGSGDYPDSNTIRAYEPLKGVKTPVLNAAKKVETPAAPATKPKKVSF